MKKLYNILAMKLNQFAFLRAFCRWFSLQTEPPTECFFNTMEEVIWRDTEYTGVYQVSSTGMVRNITPGNERIMTLGKSEKGYLLCSLFDGQESKKKRVSILVALAFVPNPDPIHKTQVNHLDGDKLNNNYWNLEWTTPSENMNHAYRTGIRKVTEGNNFMGKRVPVMQLTKEYIICKIHESCSSASRETGIQKKCISNCINGKRKTAGGYIWQFAN